MALERLTKDARAVVRTALLEEARLHGDGTAGAEHLLLALTRHPTLGHLGLQHDRIVEALALDEQRSLAAVGIATGDFDSFAGPHGVRRPGLATSAKAAIERAFKAARQSGERRLEARHLLVGVLAAENGRVPRALRLAGVDIAELRTRI